MLVKLWVRQFRAVHTSARVAFDAGDRSVSFPLGTFLHEQRFGVTCKAMGPPDFQWGTA